MAASLQLIAERAGVSTSTVARVLRGEVKGAQRRSAEKSAEILRISKELGYQPDWRARALSRGRTHSIGLLYTNPMWIFEDPMNEIVIAFTETLKAHQYDLRLIPANGSDNWQDLVLGGAVDGLVMMQHTPETAREAMEKSGLPTVLLGDKLEGDAASEIDAPHVVPDDRGGAFTATRHLLGLGHERIVFYVDESIRKHHSVPERQAGFEEAMDGAGLAKSGEVWRCDAAVAMDRLRAAGAPTAMVCYCHVEALRISREAWAHGLSIPADLSLVAFNDTWVIECMTPPLTVVAFDRKEMGRRAAQLLVERIETPDGAKQENVVIPERLVIRGTTARLSGQRQRP